MAFAMLPFGAWAAFTAAAAALLLSGGSGWAGDRRLWVGSGCHAHRRPFCMAGACWRRRSTAVFCSRLSAFLAAWRSFGLVGLFLGPVVMAAVLTVWREWVIGAT